MKRLCNRFCNFMQLYATLLFLAAAAAAQEPPSPEMAQEESGAAATSVPPVLLRDVKLQTIGEERFLEKLPPGLIFIDAVTGKVMVADENDPHGRAVCTCRDIDWHSFTNTARFNGHRLEYNQYWSQVAEGGSLLCRFGTNSWLRLVGDTSGSLANLTVDSYDPTNGVMVITADATDGAVLQVCTNLVEAEAWKTATNATVTAATDAATTWSIDMLGTDVEFYRVLAEVQREAGIHAEKTIHANAGIKMGGERWDEWPDVGAIATNAANAAVSPVETRVGALEALHEWPETCALYWTTNTMSHSGASTNDLYTYYIPTNFPTEKLMIHFEDVATNILVTTPRGWVPDRRVEIHLIPYHRSSNTNRYTVFTLAEGSSRLATLTQPSHYRYIIYRFEPIHKCWYVSMLNHATYPMRVNSSGGYSNSLLYSIETVEEWMAAVTNSAMNTLSMSPSLSPSLSPLSPAVLQPVEELAVDGLEEEVDELGFEEPGEEAERER